MSQQPSPSTSGFAVLRNRNFAFYLSSRVLGTLAVQMQSVAIGWQVYDITGNLFDLGLIGLAQFAPFLVLILPAGHVADRYNRRSVIAACLGLQFLVSTLLLLFSLSGSHVVWPVFAILVLFGCARAFMMPASQAILKNLVPLESFSQAVALSSSTFHVAVITGPVLGGLLYLAGPKIVYMVAGALLLLATFLMTRTRSTTQVISSG
ncbi:MAG: major Facilitator Superfamily protein, partial [Massilia sp.]|nr:major Facilitator Superfamily protein [Massilia sp.]